MFTACLNSCWAPVYQPPTCNCPEFKVVISIVTPLPHQIRMTCPSATASGASFFAITGSSVLSKWYGESEQNVRRLFEEAAAAAPAVIFIDEVDSLLAKRAGAADGPGGAGEASRRVTNEFLAFIDGIATTARPHSSANHSSSSSCSSEEPITAVGRVVVIAATNAPWDLDEAALSRFSARLLVPSPDAAARQVILQEAMQGVSHQLTEECFKQVAEQAEGHSGRDLIAVCRCVSMCATRHLISSLVSVASFFMF